MSIFTLERRGTYSVVAYGDPMAGRYVKVLMSGPVPVALVDHDKVLGSVVKVLRHEDWMSSQPQTTTKHRERFLKEHGMAYSFTSHMYTVDAWVDVIDNLHIWTRVSNQAVTDALLAYNKMS